MAEGRFDREALEADRSRLAAARLEKERLARQRKLRTSVAATRALTVREAAEAQIIGLPPPDYNDTSRLGNQDDVVQIDLLDKVHGKQVLFTTESYQFEHSVLRQPSVVSATIGHGAPIVELLNRFPPKQRISLRINGQLQQVGETDGYEVEGSGSGTSVVIHGRDVLAAIHDGFVAADHNLSGYTYIGLVEHAFKQVGRPAKIVASAEAHKKIGSPIRPILVSDPDNERISLERNTDGTYTKSVHARMGVRWFQVLNQCLAHAGMFMWADQGGRIVIKTPDVFAQALYEIIRAHGRNDVVSYRHRNLTTQRYSNIVIYARTGGRYAGRSHVKGRFVDEEMVRFGYHRTLTIKDNIASNEAEAEAYAGRKLAEGRRAGWGLVYTVAGHTVRSIRGKERMVWRPNTVVRVLDTELGLNDLYWIESCAFSRPPTLTALTLMRLEDVLFGAGVAP